jgi:RES domain
VDRWQTGHDQIGRKGSFADDILRLLVDGAELRHVSDGGRSNAERSLTVHNDRRTHRAINRSGRGLRDHSRVPTSRPACDAAIPDSRHATRRRHGSRWTPRGIPAVFTSAALSLAALERFVVNTDSDLEPTHFLAIPVEIRDDIGIDAVEVET